jgi:hypothetical protein
VLGDYGNLFFEFNLAGDPEPMFTSLGVRFTDETSTEERAAAGVEALNLAPDIFATETPTEYTIGPGHVEIGITLGANLFVDGGVTEVGLQVADATQQNTAWLCNKSSVTPGRKGRGRMFVPGAVDAFVSPSGILDSGYQDSLQTLIDDLALAILGVEIIEALVIFHSGEEDTPSDIIALVVDGQVATQRRRMR